jgi:hypothetical protein
MKEIIGLVSQSMVIIIINGCVKESLFMVHLNTFELFEHTRVLSQVQDVEPLSNIKVRPRRQRHLAARQGTQRREPEAPSDT